jgi:hypothetical protein
MLRGSWMQCLLALPRVLRKWTANYLFSTDPPLLEYGTAVGREVLS